MVKRVVIIGAGVFVVGLLVFGSGLVSYVQTSAGLVSQSVRESVPIDFEIERARGMVQDLVPEIRRNMHHIAKEEVVVKRLAEQIAAAETSLAKDKAQIMKLQTALQTGQSVYKFAGRDYSAEEVQIDQANRFERYKTDEATLDTWKKMHQARQKSLAAGQRKLDNMLAKRRQLQVEVENLEARVQMIAANRASSEYDFDDSRLGRAKELISDLRTRLDVEDNLVKAETQFHGEIPLDEVAPENIVEQVAEYFAEETPDVEAVAVD